MGCAVSAALPIPVIQLLQVLTIAIGAPGVNGVIAKVEARLQGRRGPRIRQPYYDLAKLFRKEALAPAGASWFFLAAPFIATTAYLTIPLLIPVLTTYGLPLGYMGDILGGGFLLSLASFVIATAALETGSPYAQLGSSRAKTFSAITEPVVLFVVFTVALLTGTDLPYALAATVRSSAGQVIRPAHLLAAAALFMVILLETGRIPVETHTGTNEFGMIEEARSFEHSGPFLALIRWGSELKQLILYTILADVFLAPWGLASTQRADAVVTRDRGPAGQGLCGRLRGRDHRQLLRQAAPVQDHRVRGGRLPARCARGVHAVPGGWLMSGVQAPGVYEGAANVIAAGMLLLEFGMLRQALVRDQLRLYMAQSGLISVLAIVIAADRNLPDLYALAALSFALKVVAVPLVMRRLLRRAGPINLADEETPGVAGSNTLSPATAVLAGIVLAAFGFFCFGAMGIKGPAAPALALALAGAMVLVSFGLMIVRRDVASQAIGFFSLENAISLAALVVASGLPLILEIAFLFDLLVAVVVFGLLIRAHHPKAESLSTADLTKLQG